MLASSTLNSIFWKNQRLLFNSDDVTSYGYALSPRFKTLIPPGAVKATCLRTLHSKPSIDRTVRKACGSLLRMVLPTGGPASGGSIGGEKHPRRPNDLAWRRRQSRRPRVNSRSQLTFGPLATHACIGQMEFYSDLSKASMCIGRPVCWHVRRA